MTEERSPALHCEQSVGYFLVRPCGLAALYHCASCGRALCDEHASLQNGLPTKQSPPVPESHHAAADRRRSSPQATDPYRNDGSPAIALCVGCLPETTHRRTYHTIHISGSSSDSGTSYGAGAAGGAGAGRGWGAAPASAAAIAAQNPSAAAALPGEPGSVDLSDDDISAFDEISQFDRDADRSDLYDS